MAILLLIYTLYTLAAYWFVARFDWTRRSVAVGGISWLGGPAAALAGLIVPNLFAFRKFWSIGIPALLSGLCATIIVCASLAGQGYRPRDFSWRLWFLIFRLALIPAALPSLMLCLFTSAVTRPVLWGLISPLLNPALLLTLVLRLTVGNGRYIVLPEAPLTHDLIRAQGWDHGDTVPANAVQYRLDKATDPDGRNSGFGAALIRALRWQYAMRSARHVPIEFVVNLSPECLTAAVSCRLLDWDNGYVRWQQAARPGDPPRTIPAFVRALAEFDRFLLQPDNPTPLIRRYERSWELKWIVRKHGTKEDYVRALAEVRRVLTGNEEGAQG